MALPEACTRLSVSTVARFTSLEIQAEDELYIRSNYRNRESFPMNSAKEVVKTHPHSRRDVTGALIRRWSYVIRKCHLLQHGRDGNEWYE